MMEVTASNQLKKLIIVGDRVLIKPKSPTDRTTSGLYLPPTVQEKEDVQSGYVIKVGPGYPIPAVAEDEPWKQTDEKIKYLPLQAQEGDVAIYLQRNAIEVVYQDEKYVIVPQSSILMLERTEDLFD
ncbi:co-chaperone GroES family protein [Cytophagaceae bacterium DM2B3-1]|uniref:Co-chaperone GroES family protein n=1 Tax=Xanthocytophaga flava TaxID=3048013 RepID=A0ABT7CPA7_9BACT|nr:co-chaperone GroES family protein [Xanthocytophaga flavus]MDJ1473005.1 co-chaperone GroES family protein [Xanthocytophaga flavus]MDJ1495351.1 co-chaperone GroES family protein [Xanthocytophaga flavus]